MPEKNNKKTPGVIVDATIAANPIKNMPMLIKELLSSKIRSQLGKKDGGSVQKKNKKLKMYENAPHTYKKLDDEVLRNLEIGDGRAKPSDKDIDYGDMMIKAGKVKKMKYGGKAVPVAKVKIERLKKMRDPYGESNFAHQISDGKDAYTQRVIAAMKESGQPFMYGGKVKKMRNGGSVNTTKSIQLNPKTGEPI
jgi:hypothetical protein